MSDTMLACLISIGVALLIQTVTLAFLAGRFVSKINTGNEAFVKACGERHKAVEKRLDKAEDKIDRHLEAHAEGGG